MNVNGEINVVSLIDVMMLLMVIFMITAPMMQSGLDVNLPNADAPPIESRNTIVVQLRRDGRLSVDDVVLTQAEFASRFKALAARKGKDVGVALLADQSIQYGRIVEVFALITRAGISQISMVTEPLDAGQR